MSELDEDAKREGKTGAVMRWEGEGGGDWWFRHSWRFSSLCYYCSVRN